MDGLIKDNLNEIKAALENMTDEDILKDRIKLLDLVNECLDIE